MKSTNSQLTFSTFYEIQWMISSKNYEISLEANRNESLQDLKMMDKPNYDLDHIIRTTSLNKL